MPYQSTWNNQYLVQNPLQPVAAPQQAMIPAQQSQFATGWNPSNGVGQQYQQQPVNGIVKVNGRESALQIQLPPNSTSVPLIDTNFDGKSGMFYVVSTDGTGSKSVEVFDFTTHVERPQAIPPDAVGREEFDAALRQIEILKGEISGLRAAIPPAV